MKYIYVMLCLLVAIITIFYPVDITSINSTIVSIFLMLSVIFMNIDID